ncbi:MAG: sulfur carrier protein ThiS [Deltaproteobacteria bacterium]|nr:sulfur carrier protein ThiS [Deltaproteobacteria bacterium]
MILKLNELPFEFQGKTLIELLEEVSLLDFKGIAVAVNEEVVAKNNWKLFELKENDMVMIIKPAQGG